MIQLAVKDLRFAYSGSNCLFENLSFEIKSGDYLGIIGPNGGGKTTLLKLLVGELKPSMGSVTWSDENGKALPQSEMAYLPQSSAMNDLLPIRLCDLLEFARLKYPHQSDFLAQKDTLLKLLKLETKEKEWIKNFSGGERQKALLAKALVTKPKVLFLDEPTKGLDRRSLNEFYHLLKKLAAETQTLIIMVDHHLQAMMHSTDFLLCLGNGTHWHDRSDLVKIAELEKIYQCEILLHHHGHHS